MKKTLYLIILIGCCFVSSAQECELLLRTARNYKAKNDYRNAIEWYRDVLNNCGDFDGNVTKEMKECERQINEKKGGEKKGNDKNAGFQIGQSQLECSGEGGTLVLELKKAPSSWSVSQVPGWLEVTSVLEDEKKAIFNASPNPNAEPREGTIELMAENGNTQEITVIQHEGVEQLSVPKDQLSFVGSGEQQTLSINANFNWNYSTSASWLQLSRQDNTLFIKCLENDLVLKRSNTITISGKETSKVIHVTQSEGETRLSIGGVPNSTITFDAAGGENNAVEVSCNDDWQVENSCKWLNVTVSGANIVVQCEANPWAERRTASFDVVTAFEGVRKTIEVEQDGAKPSIDRISLPSATGERNVNSVRPHYRSVFLKGNKGEMKVKVYSNVHNWEYRIVTNEDNWISAEASPKDSLLKLTLTDNNGWGVREADIVFTAMGVEDTLNIKQNKRGYRGIWDDYFEGSERVWKTTRFFADVYAGQAFGFRIGGLAKRWKFIEFSLLDFDVEYAYRHFYVDWEPIIRGFLPLSRDKHRWALFVGMGISVNMIDLGVAPTSFSYFDDSNFLFEIGAEFHWTKKDNISSRIFYRYDGYSSVGFSFDFYQWTKKFNTKQ